MTLTVKQIAAALGAEAFGAVDILVAAPAEPSHAGKNDLALAMSPRYEDALRANKKVQAAVVWHDADWQSLGLLAAIRVARPRMAMAGITQAFDQETVALGIHNSAVIDPTARIGKDARIGPFVVVGAGVNIGDNARIDSHSSIADGAVIGAGARIGSGVRIMRRVTIGNRVVLQPNVVIGGDGFSFVTTAPSNPEIGRRTLGKTAFAPMPDPVQHRIHSLGGVVIGDDVEIGANSTVDSGTIRPTRVGTGTKIDNLVQVGHNVIVGEHCLLCAQVAIAGSTVIGDRCVLGGKSGVSDTLTVGADCVIGGAAIVLSDVADGQFMMGYPATTMLEYRARQRALRHKAVSKPRQSD